MKSHLARLLGAAFVMGIGNEIGSATQWTHGMGIAWFGFIALIICAAYAMIDYLEGK